MRLNDLDFHVEVEGEGPPLLLLHGFTGSVRAWDEVRPALTTMAQVIAIDLIGHGRSAAPAAPERYSLDFCARDVAALLDALRLDRVNVLGYSLGGRAALHFAVHAPDRVGTLLLESASPGLADDAERVKRAHADNALADRILESGVAAFVAEWERQPLLLPAPHVSAAARAMQRDQRLANSAVGLANSLRGMGTGQQTPLWARLADVRQPTSLIVGAHDQRYRQIAERMRVRLPCAELAVVADAGHTVHLDQPARFAELVKAALDLPARSRN